MMWKNVGLVSVLVASWVTLALADACNDQCVKNAVCVNGTCECDDGYSGEPYFSCYNASESRQCRMLSDPVLQNFQGERRKISFIGMARVAEFTTDRGLPGGGTCKFILGAWTERYRGKFFIGGFQAELEQVTTDGSFENIGIRISGSVDNTTGVSSWKVEDRLHSKASYSEKVNLSSDAQGADYPVFSYLYCDIRAKVIQASFVELNIACCGITVGFRPFNPANRSIVPGFYVRYKELDNNVKFDTWGLGYEPLCLGPPGAAVQDLRIQAFSGCGDLLTLPGMSEAEDEFRHVLRRCPPTQRGNLYDTLGFMYENAKFIQCVQELPGDNEEPYVARRLFQVLRDAARYHCHNDLSACTRAISMINATCSYVIDRFPVVRDYVSQSCFPPP